SSVASALTVACSVRPTHCHKSSPDCSLSWRSRATRLAASSIWLPSRQTQTIAAPDRLSQLRVGTVEVPAHRIRQCQEAVCRRYRVDRHPPGCVEHARIGGGTI